MNFFYDLNKKLNSIGAVPESTQLNERDEGKHNNATTGFAALAKKAGKEYGSKAAGERVAGAVHAKMARAGKLEEGHCPTCNCSPCTCNEGNAFSGAVVKAKADGIQPGEKVKVGGKTYPVKEQGMSEGNNDESGSDNYHDRLFDLAFIYWEGGPEAFEAERQLKRLGLKPEYGDDYIAIGLYKIGGDGDEVEGYTIDEFEEYARTGFVAEGKGKKPDFLDLDKDGNKKESMKKAAADKKKNPFKKNMSEAQARMRTTKQDVAAGGSITNNAIKLAIRKLDKYESREDVLALVQKDPELYRELKKHLDSAEREMQKYDSAARKSNMQPTDENLPKIDHLQAMAGHYEENADEHRFFARKLLSSYLNRNEQGMSEGSENNNPIAQKIFFARSNKTPKGWSYDHVGFITQDGKQIQMSGHKGNDVYVTNAVTDDPEFPKQNIKIVSLSKPVSVPTTNSVGAENCGTFVANVLQANGIKGIDTQKIYSVFKKPHEQGVAEEMQHKKITELFDVKTAFPLQWDNQFASSGEVHAEAYDADGRTIDISFTPTGLAPILYGSGIEIVFKRGGSYDMTGHGDAPRVLATVVNAISQYLQKYQPPYIAFSAKSTGGRAGAYAAMIRRLARGYKLLTPDEYPDDTAGFLDFLGSDKPFILARS